MIDIKKIVLSIIASFSLAMVIAQTTEYTDGVFMLNEDWFGHNNSSINFIYPTSGEFDYEIIRNNQDNFDNKLSLGCTSQFGTVYGDRMYIVSKQDQDPGEGGGVNGGRLVVADAATMKIIKSFKTIFEIGGQSAADGRGFLGVNISKGYIGTSNGIFILNLDDLEIKGRIEGTENPLITGGEDNADGLGALYQNQIGMMIRAYDHVFAIQQDKGVLVINPETDTVETVIEGCFSTMTQSKDGTIWVGKNANMDYQTYPYGDVGSSGEKWEGTQLLKLNPCTLEYEVIDMPYSVGINQTWYAWTAGSLCASTKQNRLYFTFNPDKWSWFTCSLMYMYDIDENTFYQIYDSSTETRYFYGAGIRINPLDDQIYAALYLDNIDQTYFIYQLDNEGSLLQTFEPIERYWFPAMFIFPDNYAPEVSNFDSLSLETGQSAKIVLGTMATDTDNQDAAITKQIIDNDNEEGVSATISNDTLTITAGENPQAYVTVRFNSNGKVVDRILAVNKENKPSGINNILQNEAPVVFAANGTIHIRELQANTEVKVFNISGKLVWSGEKDGSDSISGLTAGQIYIVKIDNNTYKIVL